jgi:hypothetical protein
MEYPMLAAGKREREGKGESCPLGDRQTCLPSLVDLFGRQDSKSFGASPLLSWKSQLQILLIWHA